MGDDTLKETVLRFLDALCYTSTEDQERVATRWTDEWAQRPDDIDTPEVIELQAAWRALEKESGWSWARVD